MKVEQLIRKILRFTIIMTILALAIGVFYRETTKYLLKDVPLDKFIVASTYLSISHGHTFVIGAFIPLTFAFITWFVREKLTGNDIASLNKAFTVYAFGGVMSLFLLIFKGFEVVKLYSNGVSFDALNSELFFGNQALRSSLYGTAHLLLGVGVIWYLYILWKKL